ncbi:hypothetical protein NF27_FO00060 [Candidatus Jidaibacter acanthamoeba]|uniref:Uncharacterized protein n=2 Tax=Candidatus Jidaibacter acanthamoebae TaxID=86105 RepID=A0A0C1MY34_9RICK|nr:hypothetical protein NF27_FO00060 [Candidatus Jidaibacter acanthamoeba]
MIHARSNQAFVNAVSGGHMEVLKLLLEHTPDQQKREKMIHTKDNQTFVKAASGGHMEVLNLVLEHITNQEKRDKMIHDQNNQAFVKAAWRGHIRVLKLLIEHTPDQEKRDKMIHDQNNQAFVDGAWYSHMEVLKLLIEHTPDQQKRDEMIHIRNDHCFIYAARNGHIRVLKLLLEHTPNQEKRDQMIFAQDEKAFISQTNFCSQSFEFLLSLIPSLSISKFLNNKIVPKLHEQAKQSIQPYMCLEKYFKIAKRLSILNSTCKSLSLYFEEELEIPIEVSSYIFSTAIGLADRNQLKKIEAIKAEVNEESKSETADEIIRKINKRASFIEKVMKYEETRKQSLSV